MRKNIVKFFAAGAAAISCAVIPATGTGTVVTEEKHLAGITLALEKYCDTVIADIANEEKKDREAEEEPDSTDIPDKTGNGAANTGSKKTTVKANSSPNKTETEEEFKLNLVYDRLGVANVHNYLNVRKSPDESSKIVGKMTRNSGCNVYKIRNGWAKIVSGKVRGWVKAEYLITDEKAEARAKRIATLRATVSTETLNVRTLPTIDSGIYDQISADEEYRVAEDNITGNWIKRYIAKYCSKKDLRGIDLEKMYRDAGNWVMLKIDEERMFVSKDFIDFTYNLNRAVTIKQPSHTSGDSSVSGNSQASLSIADYAMQFLGNRYVWGGTSLTNGTDCSGFVMRIYEHFGYYLPRTSRAQAAATKSVSSSDVQVGDLFFYGSGSTVNHVALYIGGGQIIHASNSRDGIKISSAYYRQPLKIGRVM